MASLELFKEAVASGKVLDIRFMMKDSMRLDPSFQLYNEMKALAANVPGLYDNHDGEIFNTDESTWDDDYMDDQMVRVIDNFSHERLDHLKNVVRKLRPVPTAIAQNAQQTSRSEKASKQTDYQRQKEEDHANGSFVRAAPAALFGGLLAGGVAAIAGASGGTVAAIAGAGAVAAAAITLLATKEER